MGVRTIAALGSSLLIAWWAGATYAAEGQGEALATEAQAAFAEAVDQVDAALLDTDASPAATRALVERVLDRWFDLAVMSRAALGSRADAFSADDLADFSQEFGRYVMDLYLVRIARNRDADFEVLGSVWDEATRTVRVQAVGGRPVATGLVNARRPEPARVDYWLRRKRGEWRIVNLVIDGVDVARSFRSEFASILARSSPGELVDELRKQNERRESTNPFDR